MNISFNKPTYITLIGPPACGKSTFVEDIKQTIPDIVVISSDQIIEEYAVSQGKTYSDVYPEINFKEVNAQLHAMMTDSVENNRHIIVDRTNMTVKGRRRFMSKVSKAYQKIGIIFEYDYDQLLDRVRNRGVATGKNISVRTIDEMIDSYQEPSYDEFDLILRHNTF